MWCLQTDPHLNREPGTSKTTFEMTMAAYDCSKESKSLGMFPTPTERHSAALDHSRRGRAIDLDQPYKEARPQLHSKCNVKKVPTKEGDPRERTLYLYELLLF